MNLRISAALLVATVGLTGCSQGDEIQTVVGQLSKGNGRVCQNQAVIDTIDSIVDVRETVWGAFRYRDPHVRDQWESFLEGYQAEWSLVTLQSVDAETKTATCAGRYSGQFEASDGYETVQLVTYTVTATVDGSDFVVELDPTAIQNVIRRSANDYALAIQSEADDSVAMVPGAEAFIDQSSDEVIETSIPPVEPPAAPVPPVREDRIETVGPPPPVTDPDQPKPLEY